MNTLIINQDNLDVLYEHEDQYNQLLSDIGGVEAHYYSIEHIKLSFPLFKRLGGSIFFILYWGEERLEAVFPFQIVKNGFGGLISTITFYGEFDIYAHNVHKKFLSRDFNEEIIDDLCVRLTTEHRSLWDEISFRNVDSNDQSINYFSSKFPCASTIDNGTKSFYKAACGSNKITRKKLSNIRRCERNLEKEFSNVELKISSKVEKHDFDEIRKLHTARQNNLRSKGVERDALFENSWESEYIENLLSMWSKNNWLRNYSLRIEGELVAFGIFEHSSNVSYFFLTAINCEYEKFQPARILWEKAFEQEFDEYGVDRIDLSWGENKIKSDFSSGQEALCDIYIRSSTLKTRLLFSLRNIVKKFFHLLKVRKVKS